MKSPAVGRLIQRVAIELVVNQAHCRLDQQRHVRDPHKRRIDFFIISYDGGVLIVEVVNAVKMNHKHGQHQAEAHNKHQKESAHFASFGVVLKLNQELFPHMQVVVNILVFGVQIFRADQMAVEDHVLRQLGRVGNICRTSTGTIRLIDLVILDRHLFPRQKGKKHFLKKLAPSQCECRLPLIRSQHILTLVYYVGIRINLFECQNKKAAAANSGQHNRKKEIDPDPPNETWLLIDIVTLRLDQKVIDVVDVSKNWYERDECTQQPQKQNDRDCFVQNSLRRHVGGILVQRDSFGEKVYVRDGILEFEVAFDAQCKQTVECHAYEEGHEVDLDIAAVVGRHLETLVVNAVCGWHQNKKGAYEVGEYQMSEQEI